MSGREATPDDPAGPQRFSLRRWSQRKRAAARAPGETPAASQPDAVQEHPESVAAAGEASGIAVAPGAQVSAAAPLPPIESLTADSNFAAFMRPDVDEIVKRGALKKLFSDPRFNVMDGLDIYIDDYTRSDPIEPSLARELLSRLNFSGGAAPPAAPDVVASDDVAAMPGGDAALAAPEVSGYEPASAPTTAGVDADAGSQETGAADAVRGSSQPAPESR